ncbi:hypothetical protein F5878DRAFT_630112 [Lentinula raphanica]|uniref:Uncharacterized protein n=1 Tax=Lentinula raphanica TaxID=153919 RepID=A0AA38P1L1_9AGAR|nr:hypothetical protein F5878DRAFT_630112 [Lentinula raphanica]
MVKINTLAPGILIVLTSSLLQTSLVPSVLALPVQFDWNHGQPDMVVGDGTLATAVTRSVQSAQSPAIASSLAGTSSSRPRSSRRCSVAEGAQISNALKKLTPAKPREKVFKRQTPDEFDDENFRELIEWDGQYTLEYLLMHDDVWEVGQMIGEIEDSAVFQQLKTGKRTVEVKAAHDKALERIKEWSEDPCDDTRYRVCWWWDQLVFDGKCSQGSKEYIVNDYKPGGLLSKDHIVVQGLKNNHPESHTKTHTDTRTGNGMRNEAEHGKGGRKEEVGSDVEMEDVDPMSDKVKTTSKAVYEQMIQEIRQAARTIHTAAREKALQRCQEWEGQPDNVQAKERIIWWHGVLCTERRDPNSIERELPGTLLYYDSLAMKGVDLTRKRKATYQH